MKPGIKLFIVVPILFSFFAHISLAQLHSLETKNLILITPSPVYNFAMPYMGQCFENALDYHQKRFDYQPDEPTTVFMQDFWDYGNAGATAIPNNYVRIGIAPLSYTYETSPANERINHTMNHELVHIVASDKASKNDMFYRKIFFGKPAVSSEDPLSMFYSYLTNPRRYSPRWYHEGIAVFMETWMAGGIGRAYGNYDEMVFRAMVLDSAYFYSVVGLESEGTAIDFQVGVNSYLYGTRFMSYLVLHYGPEMLIDWISGVEERNKYFASDFEKKYGISLDDAWDEWIQWEKIFQKENLAAIHEQPISPHRPLMDKALGSVSRGYFDKEKNKLYVSVLYPAQSPHIAAIDIENNTMEKICNIKGAGLYYVTSLTSDPTAEKIYYTTDNTSWRDLNVVDIKTGKTGMLIRDVRTGDLTFNRVDKPIWGIRHYNGISTIVRIPYSYKEWNQIYSWPFGQDMYDIDIAPEGKSLIGALAQINGDQILIKMDVDSLLADKPSYTSLFNFGNSLPANFVFSEDGKYLFGSSYYTGVSNIYRYDLEDNDIFILSNCETGFFRPIPVSNDSLMVFNYTGNGFVPAMIANTPLDSVSAITFLGGEIVKKHPVIEDWLAEAPSTINIDSLKTFLGNYNDLGNLRLNSLYPIIEGYKDHAAVGLRFDMMDWLGVSALTGKISYTPNTRLAADERFHANLKFRYWDWEMKFSYNHADFYDLFGPTKTSRKGYSLGMQYDKSLIYDKPEIFDLNINLTGYANLERLPFFQNVTTPVQEFLTFGASLKYSYLLRTLGAVEEEKGFHSELISYNYYANDQIFPHLLLNLDYGFLLPIDHSSLWLRSSIGISRGDRDIAFSNYYFGGFGNNWIDDKLVNRYREFYSFPGVELNSIEAQNYIKLLLEWPLPPIRFRRAGFTSLYLNWTRLSLFSSGLAEDLHNETYRGFVANIGAQLDFKLVLFTYMSTTFSVGYAGAFREGQRLSNELMISLKIL